MYVRNLDHRPAMRPWREYARLICLLAILALGCRSLQAQTEGAGSIRGTTMESWNGQPLSGVAVSLRGTTLAVITDAQGHFELSPVMPGLHTVQFSKSGYARAVVTEVLVAIGQASQVNLSLRPEFYEMEEYVVTAPELEEQEARLQVERQSAASVIESIGSERFSQLAAGDAAEIMTKITGVSVVEGKFAVIRGLSDRYNTATLNGADVPSADPYRRSAQLDLFPSEVIENVTVSKTFTPDLPGGFSGGAMNIVTKTFPEKFVGKVSAGLAYNTQATGNEDFLTYPGGGLDAFAMDDGTRALPGELEGVSGEDLDELRRTATSGSQSIPLDQKTAAAQEMDRYVRSFGTPYMGWERKAPPPDHDFAVLVGDTVEVWARPFGFFAGLNYERDYRFYEDGIRARYAPVQAGARPQPYAYFDDSRSVTVAQWSALVNLAYRLSDLHELAFNFLYVQNAEDQARRQYGQISSSGEDQFNDERRTHLNTLYWTERNLNTYQLRGQHQIPELHSLQADWLASLANTSQDEPDLRYLNVISSPVPEYPDGPERRLDVGNSNTPFPDRPVRYFRHLEDENFNGRLDFTLPGEDWRALEWKLKAGAFLSQSQRQFEERTFTLDGGNGSLADPDVFPYHYMLGTNAPPPQLITQNNRQRYTFSRALSSFYGNSVYDGQQDISALYAMGEVPILEPLKLLGGVRYETTLLEVNSTAYQSSDVFTGTIEQGDLLPAVSAQWSLRSNMTVRASFSETVARPTYREFARYRSFDPAGDQIIEGNPYLRMTQIQNLDLRWEWYTDRGGLVSVGTFYKLLTDPIEKFNAGLQADGTPTWTSSSDFVTFLNSDEATVWGVEFEGRQNLGVFSPLLDPFSTGVNFAWINSEVALQPEIQQLKYVTTGEWVETRPLYDQSPYILNADLTYENKKSGTTASLVFYYAAERLALIVNNGWDVYEQGAPQLDFVVSQRLGRGFKLKVSAENVLNPEIIRSYGVSGPTDTTYLYSSYRRGVTLGLSCSYEF